MSITLVNVKGQTVVDSRIIAEGLGIEHESLLRTISRYEVEIEQAFGVLRFEVGASQMPDGRTNPNPPKHFLLTEDQATFILTLSRNTPQVVAFKIGLVKAFSELKFKQVKKSTPKKLHSDKERAAGIVARREHTDAIAMFNPTPKDYAIATNQTYLGMFGQTAAEIKDERGLKQKQSARDGMNDVELAAIRLTELAVARDRSIANLNQLSAANYVQADAISKALKVRHLPN